jgi:hypothetical protein
MRCNMAGYGRVIGPFGGGEGVKSLADRLPERLEGSSRFKVSCRRAVRSRALRLDLTGERRQHRVEAG